MIWRFHGYFWWWCIPAGFSPGSSPDPLLSIKTIVISSHVPHAQAMIRTEECRRGVSGSSHQKVAGQKVCHSCQRDDPKAGYHSLPGRVLFIIPEGGERCCASDRWKGGRLFMPVSVLPVCRSPLPGSCVHPAINTPATRIADTISTRLLFFRLSVVSPGFPCPVRFLFQYLSRLYL